MTKDELYYIQMTIPAGFNNIEGSTSFPTANKQVMCVFVEGKQYDLVYTTPVGRQVRYNKIFGRFSVDNVTDSNRKLTIIIKK